MPIKIEYALDTITDKLVHISSDELKRGLNVNIKCLCCNESLEARAKESVKRHEHFSHQSKSKCKLTTLPENEAKEIYGETLLHRKAKELFEKEKEIFIPPKIILSIIKHDINLDKFDNAEFKYSFLGYKVNIIKVELEKSEGNIKPDIKLWVNSLNPKDPEKVFELLVEIAVTHFVDNIKKNKIISSRKNCIEINLHDFDRDLVDNDEEVLKALKNINRYNLINFYVPGADTIQLKLNNQYLHALSIHNQKIRDKREVILTKGLNLENKLKDIKDLKFKRSLKCVCCNIQLINNITHFKHPENIECILYTGQDLDFHNSYKYTVYYYELLNYLKESKNIFLKEGMVIPLKSITYKGIKTSITVDKIPLFNQNYKIINVEKVNTEFFLFKIIIQIDFQQYDIYFNILFEPYYKTSISLNLNQYLISLKISKHILLNSGIIEAFHSNNYEKIECCSEQINLIANEYVRKVVKIKKLEKLDKAENLKKYEQHILYALDYGKELVCISKALPYISYYCLCCPERVIASENNFTHENPDYFLTYNTRNYYKEVYYKASSYYIVRDYLLNLKNIPLPQRYFIGENNNKIYYFNKKCNYIVTEAQELEENMFSLTLKEDEQAIKIFLVLEYNYNDDIYKDYSKFYKSLSLYEYLIIIDCRDFSQYQTKDFIINTLYNIRKSKIKPSIEERIRLEKLI